MSSSADALAVIVAGGSGTRFGGRVPKQFLPVAGRPMLAWTLDPFRSHPRIARVTVVVPPEQAAAPPDWLADLRTRGLEIVAGGAERTDSVRLGLETADGSLDLVIVHDGARPLITTQAITKVLGSVRPGRGAIAARPVTDTLKAASADGRILRTVERAGLWRAETPQAFPRDMIADAYRRATAEGVTASDCASLCERYGSEVAVVEIEEPNLKVTTPVDLGLAEAWLATREEPGRRRSPE